MKAGSDMSIFPWNSRFRISDRFLQLITYWEESWQWGVSPFALI